MQSLFVEGNVIILNSCSTGKNLRITGQGAIEGLGEAGKWGQLHALNGGPGFEPGGQESVEPDPK